MDVWPKHFSLSDALLSVDFRNRQSTETWLIALRGACEAIDLRRLAACEEARICAEARRYGKGGVLLSPYGYHHPSVAMPVVTPNGKRGRLVRRAANPDYLFDYDDAGRLAKIYMPQTKIVTYCFREGNVISYLSRETLDEATLTTLAFEVYREGGGLLYDVVISILPDWRYADIHAELCSEVQNHAQTVNWIFAVAGENQSVFFMKEYDFTFRYDARGTMIGWRGDAANIL